MGIIGQGEQPRPSESEVAPVFPTPAEIRGTYGDILEKKLVRLLDVGQTPSVETAKWLISRMVFDSDSTLPVLWPDTTTQPRQMVIDSRDLAMGNDFDVIAKGVSTTFPEGINDSSTDFGAIVPITFKILERLEPHGQEEAFKWMLELIDSIPADDMQDFMEASITGLISGSQVGDILAYDLIDYLYERREEIFKYGKVSYADESGLGQLAYMAGIFEPRFLVRGLGHEPDEQKRLELLGLAFSLSEKPAELIQGIRDEVNEPRIDEIAKSRLESAGKVAIGFSPDDPRPFHTCLESVYENANFENYEVNKKITTSEVALIQQVLGECSLKDGIILDLACGTGRISIALSIANPELSIVGVDISETNLAKARGLDSNHKIDYRTGDWKTIPFPDKSARLVILLGRSIQHSNPEEVLQIVDEISRLLPSGGELLVDVGNPNLGDYLENRKISFETATRLGAKDRQTGEPLHHLEQVDWIVDSPNGIDYYTRWSPQIHTVQEKLSASGKFEVSVYHVAEIPDGHESQNVYLLAKRVEEPPDPAQAKSNHAFIVSAIALFLIIIPINASPFL